MASDKPTIMITRRDQMVFRRSAPEIDRMRRFGAKRVFASGDYLVRAGEQVRPSPSTTSPNIRRDRCGRLLQLVRVGLDLSGRIGRRKAFFKPLVQPFILGLRIGPGGWRVLWRAS